MKPKIPAMPSFRRRLLPQFRMEGCRRWRRTLREACRDYAVLQFMAKYNCDETIDEIQTAVDDFREVPHRCFEECWGKTDEYRKDVCSRYARLLERKMRSIDR